MTWRLKLGVAGPQGGLPESACAATVVPAAKVVMAISEVKNLSIATPLKTGPKGLRVVETKTSNSGIVTSGLLLRRWGSLDDDRPGAPTIGCLEPLGEAIGHHVPSSPHCET